MSEKVTEAMLRAAYEASGCPISEHGPGPRNREVFTEIYLAMRAASGIETEGHDPEEGHGAKHESPTAEGGDAPIRDAQNTPGED